MKLNLLKVFNVSENVPFSMESPTGEDLGLYKIQDNKLYHFYTSINDWVESALGVNTLAQYVINNELLTKKEMDYLKGMLYPFKECNIGIKKVALQHNNLELLKIIISSEELQIYHELELPTVPAGKYYSKLDTKRKTPYTLDELAITFD